MKPYYHQDSVILYHGDCREILAALPEKSVNCCVTSPPYFGLRDYGTGEWAGGSDDCDHKGPPMRTTGGLRDGWDSKSGIVPDQMKSAEKLTVFRETCKKCGATRVDKQIGLEKTPDEFVAELVKVFREVRRVLKDDGTLWVNLGDSYSRGTRGESPNDSARGTGFHSAITAEGGYGKTSKDGSSDGKVGRADRPGSRNAAEDLASKNLLGIPWKVAFALQADGWILRQDIIWAKGNPMPESVTDRCTKSHEYIFLLSKSQRYYFDAESIKEQAVCGWNDSEFDTGKTGDHQLGRAQKRESRKRGEFGGKTSEMPGREAFRAITETRNKRSVWTVNPKPYKGAHFATYPPELIAPCIAAGCPEGGVVLDPFNGSGTTGEVAKKHGCSYIGCDLNESYLKLAIKRLRQGFLFGSVG